MIFAEFLKKLEYFNGQISNFLSSHYRFSSYLVQLCSIPVFPKHTIQKPKFSRHTYQFAFIFLPSNIAFLVLDQLNLQLNVNQILKFGILVALRHFLRHSKFFWRHTVWGTLFYSNRLQKCNKSHTLNDFSRTNSNRTLH